MKTARFPFVMILGVVLMQDASFARASNQASDKTSPKGKAAVTASVPKPRPSESHPKQPHRHSGPRAAAPPAGDLRTAALGGAAQVSQTRPSPSTGAAHRADNRRGMLVPSPTGAANGQQFTNPHNPGARLVTSGGPARSPRGTATINGTNLKPRP